MAYYDRIAKQWHEARGPKGGPFQRKVLNRVLLRAIGRIEGRRILELGAGNGYFFPMVLRRNPGQQFDRLVLSDLSGRQLETMRRHFRIDGAEYQRLDARQPFVFQDASFDLVVATMVFSELKRADAAQAIAECRRILAPRGGQLLATVVHPDFVADLDRRGDLRINRGVTTMPGGNNLWLPVEELPPAFFQECLAESGFTVEVRDLCGVARPNLALARVFHARL